MSVRVLRRILWPAALLGALSSVTPAHAWLSAIWSVDEIARHAYVIAVGEVTDTSVVGGVPAAQAGGAPMLVRMTAHVTVLRSYSDHDEAALAPGETISITYRSLRGNAGMGPPYVSLKVGDCFAFPLKGPRPDPTHLWELIDDVSEYSLVPCAKDTPLVGAIGEDFLLNELAGALASGDRTLVLAAAHQAVHPLLYDHEGRKGLVQEFGEALDRFVGDDETHWLNIAVALYISMGTPRPTLAQIAHGDKGEGGYAAAVAYALSRVSRTNLDRRLLDALLQWADVPSGDVGGALKDNYWHDPEALQRLTQLIEAGDLNTFLMLAILVHTGDHPLAAPTLKAALNLLRDRTALSDAADGQTAQRERALREVGRLVARLGDDAAFTLLLTEVREAQKTDPRRFDLLWQGVGSGEPPRVIQFCRLGIDDRRTRPAYPTAWRYCDTATAYLQRATGEDFGLTGNADLAQRDAAVARAKAWLAAH
jgi:hypothetical protein